MGDERQHGHSGGLLKGPGTARGQHFDGNDNKKVREGEADDRGSTQQLNPLVFSKTETCFITARICSTLFAVLS